MSALAITVTCNFVDSKGKTSKTSFRLPTSTTLAALPGLALGIAETISTLSRARMTRVTACIGLAPGTVGSPQSTSDVQEKMQITFVDTDGLFGKMVIPTLDESYVSAGSDAINISDPDIDDLLTLITAGDGTVAPVTVRGGDISLVTNVREIFRRTK